MGAACAQSDAQKSLETTAPEVQVVAPRLVTPLPGIYIEREQTTTNVQTATGREIEASKAISLTDFMNDKMQSVNINDYQGNPFQQDLSFRGFSASPQIGTPQGLSVYLDGVRVNEPFGEVVNWDMIPMNAIRQIDLLPGSNPLFGLNTLGGAIAIATKSGFTNPGVETQVAAGNYARRQVQASVGANNGKVGAFVAINGYDEDGWRMNSPSSIRQAFAKGNLQGRLGEVGLTVLYVDNSLTGNGLVPTELYDQQRNAVFTSPDQTTNRLTHIALNGRLDLSATTSVSAMAYQRQFNQNSVGGDFFNEWDAAANGRTGGCPNPAVSTFPDGAAEVNAPGCPNVTPNGVFNFGTSDQRARGVTLNYNWAGEKHQIVLGGSYDTNDITFAQKQRLGWIGPNGVVFLDPSTFATVGLTPLIQDIQRNNLTGTSSTLSWFGLGVFTVKPGLNVTAGARYNQSNVQNHLISDRPIPLYQFSETLMRRLQNRCGAETDPFARYFCTEGNFNYYSLNPYLGASWLATPTLNLFANVSRGSRVPSVIELGCARDRVAEAKFAGQNNGQLQGCSIPTALTSDPFLPQVTSTSYEIGARGDLRSRTISWNAAVFRTDLTDDILFVSLGKSNQGVFDTFGKTRRQGAELGLTGTIGRHTFRASYTYLDATFQSSARVVNNANSSADHTQGQLNEFVIQPGDRIPGLPQHMLRLGWDVALSSRFTVGVSMIADSWSYSRGNENNQAQPGGTSSNGSLVVDKQGNTVVDPGRRYVATGRTSGYAVFNLAANYRFGSAWSMFLRVDNVFNTEYETASQLGLNPFAPSHFGFRDAAGFNYNSNDWLYTNFVGPGAPRAFWIGVSYSFSPSGAKAQ